MKSRNVYGVCLLALTGFLLPHSAQAACTVASFSGTFNYTLVGTVDGVPLTIKGTLIADGTGKLTDTNTITYAHPPVTNNSDAGTYQMNANCTGSLIFHYSSEIVHFDFVLVNGGTELYLVCTDPNTVLSGTGTKGPVIPVCPPPV